MMQSFVTPAATMPRMMKFLEAFRSAPDDADITITVGKEKSGIAAIFIEISGAGRHPFLVNEARVLATVMEDAMRAFPHDPEAATLPNTIMGIRAGCDAAEIAFGKPTDQ